MLLEIFAQSGVELDREQTQAVERRFEELLKASPRTNWLIMAGIAVMLVTGCVIGSGVVEVVERLGGSTLIVGITAGLVTPACLVGIWFLIFPRLMRRGMRQALRDCGHDVCVRCGYNLTATDAAGPCPECGRAERSPLDGAGS